MRILVVEDEKILCDTIVRSLSRLAYSVDSCYDGGSAMELLAVENYDLVVLDLNLPGEDGMTVLRTLRKNDDHTKVLILSARCDVMDKVDGLDAEADDYLTKPFSVEELLARLRVTFRRISMLQNAAGCSVFTNGDLQIDFAAGCATLKGQELHLTPIEYRLLCVMAKNCGKVLTHTYITHEVWGSSWDNDVASLRVFMATLRKKLESEPDSPQYIQTHIGVGYRMLKVE